MNTLKLMLGHGAGAGGLFIGYGSVTFAVLYVVARTLGL